MFLDEYPKQPSAIWKETKMGVKIKLQRFQFPQGLTFQNKLFGTNEMSIFFKAKEVISDEKSSIVDYSPTFWNQLGKDLVQLDQILRARDDTDLV